MNMKLLFVTYSDHKICEIRKLIGNDIELLYLKEIRSKYLDSIKFTGDIPENQDTIEGNASEKSHFGYDNFSFNCFADDTGLEIEALNGEPGVKSARYAGDDKDAFANMKKVLEKMAGVENRKARFKTVISLILDGKEYLFEGIVEGEILKEPRGLSGFGYDPIFVPDGYNKTFAEMSLSEKNKISHRARATKKLVAFLNSLQN